MRKRDISVGAHRVQKRAIDPLKQNYTVLELQVAMSHPDGFLEANSSSSGRSVLIRGFSLVFVNLTETTVI